MTNKYQTTKNNNHKNHGRRKKRLMFLIVLLLAFLITAIAFRLFGSVDMVSSDISNPVSTSFSDKTVSQTTQNKNTISSQPTEQTTIQKSEIPTSTKAGKHYIQPAGADWNLKLVNAWNRLDNKYEQPLVTYSGNNKFDSRAIDKLRSLVNAGKSYNIRVASLFRSQELQISLFEKQVQKELAKGYNRSKAEELASTVVARPGTSEHNLGLAVDFLFEQYSSLEVAFENTEAYSWMMNHCADFGFILRYPKNKQSITGVIFEPWHYRYVGEQAAKEIMSREITLEEYLQEKGK